MNAPRTGAAAADVVTRDDDGVRWVILNRPQSANGADPALMKALCLALDEAIADPAVVAIVLRGEGRHFLAGGDLDWLSDIGAGTAPGAAEEIYSWFQGTTRRLIACPKPVVAAITGAAMTVGCEVALACDVRLIDRRAFFQQSWLELGLIAPLGGSKLLPQLVGMAKAKEILLECRRIDAEEALAIGLANAIAETADDLYGMAQQRAMAMAARPAEPFARMKRLLHDALSQSLEEAWKAGVAAQGELLEGDDFRSAVRAVRPAPTLIAKHRTPANIGAKESE